MKMILAFLIFFESMTPARAWDLKVSGASLSRQEYKQAETFLSKQKDYEILALFHDVFSSKRVLDRVVSHFNTKEVSDFSIRELAHPLLAGLVLARQGYPRTARRMMSATVAAVTAFGSDQIRRGGRSREEASALVSSVIRWTVVETLSEMGGLKPHENQKMYDTIGILAEDLKKEDGQAFRKRKVLDKFNGTPGALALVVSMPFSAAVMTVYMRMMMVSSMSFLEFSGFFVSSIILFLSSVVALTAVSFAPYGIREYQRTPVPDFQKLGQDCEELLTSSGEIVP